MSSEAPKPSAAAPVPESPTTARPLEMDDDDVQETGVIDNGNPTATAPAPAAQSSVAPEENAPPKPPRPVSEQQQKIIMLREAFPSIDEAVIKAVLTASRGQVEPAFNALLQMTDPDAAKDDDSNDQPPPQPPRPVGQAVPPSSTSMSQLEADELYARQLAEHYESVGQYEARTSNRGAPQGYGHPQQNPQYPQRMHPQQSDYDREHNFFDDELPVIKEQLRKGFLETQSKFTEWVSTMKKKIDGDLDDPNYHDDGPRPGHGRPGRRQGEPSRRSNDYDRYDADPQLLTDDFAGMKFNPDGTPAKEHSKIWHRPPPESTSPNPKKVAFKEHIEDIDDIYDTGPSRQSPKDASAPAKTSKWQPMSTVDPNPIAENDPFSLGDSDDEKDTKDKPSSKGDHDDLQKATAEAMADSLVEPGKSAPDAASGVKKT